MNSNKKVRKTK